MAIITAAAEIAALRQSGKIAADTLRAAAAIVAPGENTARLDKIAGDYIRQHGGQPSFLGYQDYPASLCVSINDEVVHGIPSAKRILQAGDIVGLDVGVVYKGIYTDCAISVPVGRIDADSQKLLADTKQALTLAIQAVRPGATTGDIGAAVQRYAEPKGYGIIRALCGHGVGRAVHESPSIPNFGQPHTGSRLQIGQVIAIEPMVSAGGWEVDTLPDGWTAVTADHSRAAHFEHTVWVTATGAEIITI